MAPECRCVQGSKSSSSGCDPAPSRPRSSARSIGDGSRSGDAARDRRWGTAVVINTGERDEFIVRSQYRVAASIPTNGKNFGTVSRQYLRIYPYAGRRPRPGFGHRDAPSDHRDQPAAPAIPQHSRRVSSRAAPVRALRHRRRDLLYCQRHAEHLTVLKRDRNWLTRIDWPPIPRFSASRCTQGKIFL